ncbi:MAG: CRTAC1 family protein [Caldilinea sp.]|nr:CRTAC1 family protein [Caldilinea sp.]MDW8440897.1 CRTAC1 family protein [Caldilineaceae bacterium]
MATTIPPFAPKQNPSPSDAVQVAVEVRAMPLVDSPPCVDAFIAHELPHLTSAGADVPRLFDSNGSGLALNDLNGDGRIDIVLGDLSGPPAILWNQGHLQFRRSELPMVGRARSVGIVDVDGDALPDIVIANGIAAPAFFRNEGHARFRFTSLPGVDRPTYAMAWGDLDGDGDLDLVTGSYDAGRQVESGPNYLFNASGGVQVYLQENGEWRRRPLAESAHALAISLWDLNGDHRADIWVGNDFAEMDRVWLQNEQGTWIETAIFAQTTHNTMGIDRGDIDGDGIPEYFATDMKPYSNAVQTLAAWLPLMDKAAQRRRRGDPQISENTLQIWREGRYVNEAYERKVDATGWSWSGKMGDLDHDGDLDLYVVNGMIAGDLFPYLPNGELIEENQALVNTGNGWFAPAAHWQLGSLRSGRSMSMADMDNDGDLDIVVNNLNSPAQLFENRLCVRGGVLTVELRWPAAKNHYAIGAVATLYTRQGLLVRDVRAIGGYLSGDPVRLHFGVPSGATPGDLRIRWPDGAVSSIKEPPLNHLLIANRLD